MSVRHFVAACVVGAVGFAAGTFLTAGTAWSEDAPKPDAPKTAGGMPSEEEIWKMMAERAAPTDEHRKLAALAGTWDADVDCSGCTNSGGATRPSKGTWTSESLLGGRVLVSRFDGDLAGHPYQGVQLRGYDKEKKQHWTIWCDTMGTGFLRLLGDRAGDGGVALRSDEFEHLGMKCVIETATKVVDADHQTFDMTCRSPGAPEQKMAIRYTRRK